MKLQFSMIVAGEDSLEKKFHDRLNENPHLHMELIKGFAQILMLGLGLNQNDNIVIESFRAGKITENPSEVVSENESLENMQASSS